MGPSEWWQDYYIGMSFTPFWWRLKFERWGKDAVGFYIGPVSIHFGWHTKDQQQ